MTTTTTVLLFTFTRCANLVFFSQRRVWSLLASAIWVVRPNSCPSHSRPHCLRPVWFGRATRSLSFRRIMVYFRWIYLWPAYNSFNCCGPIVMLRRRKMQCQPLKQLMVPSLRRSRQVSRPLRDAASSSASSCKFKFGRCLILGINDEKTIHINVNEFYFWYLYLFQYMQIIPFLIRRTQLL